MGVYVITGPDGTAVRREVAARAGSATVERFDLVDGATERLVLAAHSFSLFGDARALVADPVTSLTPEAGAALADRAPNVTVILTGPEAPRGAVARALEHATFISCPLPTRRDAAARVHDLLTTHRVSVDPATSALLASLAPEHWDRVQTVVAQVAELGGADPSGQVRALLGTTMAARGPWVLTRALERGDAAGALDVASDLDPIPTVAYLGTWLAGFKACPPRGWSPGALAAAWDLVGRADREVKVAPAPRQVLLVLVGRLSRLRG